MAETTVSILMSRLEYLERKVREDSTMLARTPGHERGLQRHSRELRAVRERLARLESRTKLLADQASEVQNAAFTKETARISARLDSLWADLNAEVQDLHAKLALQGESVARAHDRLDAAFGQNDERVVTREWVAAKVGSGKFPAWGFLLAFVVGILVMLWTAGPWTLSGPVLAHGKTVGMFAADFHGARWGVVVGLVAAGLVILIVSLLPVRQGSSRVSRSVRSIRRRRAHGSKAQATQQHVVPIEDLLEPQEAAK